MTNSISELVTARSLALVAIRQLEEVGELEHVGRALSLLQAQVQLIETIIATAL
jgi:hypothetical protein